MSFKLRKWYWAVVAVWCVTGLPLYLLGQGFAGPEKGAFTLSLLIESLTPPANASAGALINILLFGLVILLPLVAFPFAITRKRGADERNRQLRGNYKCA
jgi:uncharacterized membrane protein YhaH (DUF805 family)